jgi:hypothetical protein
MANFNGLILTAAEYKVTLTLNNGVIFLLNTLESFGYEATRDEELIPAIGQAKPIGVKSNFAKYRGSMSMQIGEISSILRLGGLAEPTEITKATLALIPTNPLAASIIFQDVQVTSGKTDIKAGELKTVTNMDWVCLEITSI